MTQPPVQPQPGQPQYAPISPPHSPYPPPYFPTPKKSFWSSPGGVFTIIGIVIGAVFLMCVGLGTIGLIGDRAAAEKMDVQITSCTFTGGSLPSATVGLSVTNNGDSIRSASIKIEYRDSSGARIDTDTARVRDVKPGDTVRTEETTLLDAAPSGSGRCEVVGVS